MGMAASSGAPGVLRGGADLIVAVAAKRRPVSDRFKRQLRRATTSGANRGEALRAHVWLRPLRRPVRLSRRSGRGHICGRSGASARRATRLATGRTATRLIRKALLLMKCLLARGKNEVGAARNTAQRPVGVHGHNACLLRCIKWPCEDSISRAVRAIGRGGALRERTSQAG